MERYKRSRKKQGVIILTAVLILAALFGGMYIVEKIPPKDTTNVSREIKNQDKDKKEKQEKQKQEKQITNKQTQSKSVNQKEEKKAYSYPLEFFDAEIKPILNTLQGNNSIYYSDLKQQNLVVSYDSYAQKSDSLICPFITAYAYEQISLGAVNMEVLSKNIDAMLTTGDLKATNDVINLFGFDLINNYIKTNGYALTSLQTGTNSHTSVSDMGLFFKKLYNKDILYSDEIMNLLAKSKDNDMISNALSTESGIKTYEKGSSFDKEKINNVAGIITTPKGSYVLVVMCQGDEKQKQQDTINQIIKKVNNYYVNK